MAFNGRGSASGTSGNGKESDEDKIKRLKVEKNDYSNLHLTGTSSGIWYLNFGLLLWTTGNESDLRTGPLTISNLFDNVEHSGQPHLLHFAVHLDFLF